MKKYQNELLVIFALLLMLGAYFYKSKQITTGVTQVVKMQNSISEIKEIAGLKRVWADKRISKKVESLGKLVDAAKVKWSKKGKKLTASYKDIDPKELNKLITSILNLAVQIQELIISRNNTSYAVEFKCKW